MVSAIRFRSARTLLVALVVTFALVSPLVIQSAPAGASPAASAAKKKKKKKTCKKGYKLATKTTGKGKKKKRVKYCKKKATTTPTPSPTPSEPAPQAATVVELKLDSWSQFASTHAKIHGSIRMSDAGKSVVDVVATFNYSDGSSPVTFKVKTGASGPTTPFIETVDLPRPLPAFPTSLSLSAGGVSTATKGPTA